jgi:hypothetical protein
LATVKETGDWPKSVDIRCVGEVAFGKLIEQLQKTLKEREMIIAAVKSGVAGPYKFERSVWEQVDLLGPL